MSDTKKAKVFAQAKVSLMVCAEGAVDTPISHGGIEAAMGAAYHVSRMVGDEATVWVRNAAGTRKDEFVVMATVQAYQTTSRPLFFAYRENEAGVRAFVSEFSDYCTAHTADESEAEPMDKYDADTFAQQGYTIIPT